MNINDPSRDDVIYSDNAFEAILDHPLHLWITVKRFPTHSPRKCIRCTM